MSFDPSTRERWSGYSAMRRFFRQQEKYGNDSNFDGWHGFLAISPVLAATERGG
jgi:hypothetical protein